MKGVSIVICTYNGRQRLPDTLRYILSQEFPLDLPVELILVDNRSTDGTAEYTQRFFSEHSTQVSLRIITEQRPGKAYAVETGYDAANYDTIVTCDDDNWLAPGFVYKAYELMQAHPDASIIGSCSEGSFEEPTPEWFHKFEKSYAIGKQAKCEGYASGNGNIIWGAGMVLRRKYWQQLRQFGFEFVTGKHAEKAVGEDSELCLLAPLFGWKLYYTESLCLRHYMPAGRISWHNYLKMCKGFGITGLYIEYYTACQAKNAKTLEATAFLKSYKFLIRKKIAQLVVTTKGRCLVEGLLPEGNKFRAQMVRHLSSLNEASKKKIAISNLLKIQKFIIVATALQPYAQLQDDISIL